MFVVIDLSNLAMVMLCKASYPTVVVVQFRNPIIKKYRQHETNVANPFWVKSNRLLRRDAIQEIHQTERLCVHGRTENINGEFLSIYCLLFRLIHTIIVVKLHFFILSNEK